MNAYSVQTMQNWEKIPHKRYVQVNYEYLSVHAKAVALQEFPLFDWNTPGVHPNSHASFASHSFWHCVQDFCFGYPHLGEDGTLEKFRTVDTFGEVQKGSYGMGACFYRAFGEKPVPVSKIRHIAEKPERTKRFFIGFNDIPMIEKRREFLLDASDVLENRYRGNPIHILEEGNYRAFGSERSPGVVDLLSRDFPTVFGSDRAFLDSHEFAFLKRAQLFILEYNGRAVHSRGALRPIEDAEELGPIVDYQIPRYYRDVEVFDYSGELDAHIFGRVPIPPRSRMEVELRGATMYAFSWELVIINETRRAHHLPPIGIAQLDSDRWSRGREVKNPHHLCWTTDY